MIDKKRQEVFDELQHIEERMKNNFELRKKKEPKDEGEIREETDKTEENGDLDTTLEEKHEDGDTDMFHEASNEEKNPILEEPSNGTEEVRVSDEQSTQGENWDGEAIPEENKDENLSDPIT